MITFLRQGDRPWHPVGQLLVGLGVQPERHGVAGSGDRCRTVAIAMRNTAGYPRRPQRRTARTTQDRDGLFTEASERGSRTSPCGSELDPPLGHCPRDDGPLARKQHSIWIIGESLYDGHFTRQDSFKHS
jgi:hypothetical protein